MKSAIMMLLVGLFTSFPTAHAVSDSIQESLTRFENNCLLARNLEAQVAQERQQIQQPHLMKDPFTRQVLATGLLKKINSCDISQSDLGSSFFLYYQARLIALTGRHQEAKFNLMKLVGNPSVAPEALSELIGISMAAQDSSQKHYEELLAKLIPASGYSQRANSRATLRMADVRGTPLLPNPNTYSLIAVAERCSEIKMYDQAVTAYAEAICTTFFPVRIVDPYGQSQSWLSFSSAPLWLKAAQAEWQSGGNTEKAANYMAKAIVFGTDSTKNQALKTLSQWRENGKPQKPPIAQPDAAKLKRIAELYAEMNLHPRAIALVKEFAPAIGAEAPALQKRYEEEWLSLLERYCFAATKCTVFGQDVSQKENRLKVVIPPPLRPEALAEAAKTVAALAKEK